MQATKKKMEESDICLLRESLIVQLLNTMKAGDTLIIDTVRRIWPKEKSLIPVYSWLLQNGKHLFSVQQPFLDTRLYKPLIASADESAINAYVSGYIPQVYRTMNIAQHVAISSVADDLMLKPGDSKKREIEIRETAIRRHHEVFGGYSNCRQIAEMLVQECGFPSISERQIRRDLDRIIKETGINPNGGTGQ